MATAVSLVNGIIALVIIILSNKLSRKLGDVVIW